MTIEEVTAVLEDLRQKIPNLQRQLHQAEGYLQALLDMQGKEDLVIYNKKKDKNAPTKNPSSS